MRKMSMVAPSIPQDVGVLLDNLDTYFCFLPISSLIIIGPDKLKLMLPNDNRIKFISEDALIDKRAIKGIIEKRQAGEEKKKDRTGWYIQQFLKMAYAKVCDDEYYLLWDSDTLPLKEIELFDNQNKPYLDYKTEYFKPYFETLERLLPGYNKIFKGSFISEHMVIKTSHMKELLRQIEANINIEGTSFDEKIINSIETKYLSDSGFSEFETIGTFVLKNYSEEYTLRRWKSMRHGGFFYPISRRLSERQRLWLSKEFHAISFEKADELSTLSRLVNSSCYTTLFSPVSLNVFSFAQRIIRKVGL